MRPSNARLKACSTPLISSVTLLKRWTQGCSTSSQDHGQNSHAGLYSVAHLFVNAGLGAIGDFAGQLHAAYDRTGMHQDGVRLGQHHALRRHLVVCDVILDAVMPAREPLFLDAQRHHHIGTLQSGIQIMADRHSRRQSRRDLRHKVVRAAEDDLCAEAREQFRIGARHPAVIHVADDDHA